MKTSDIHKKERKASAAAKEKLKAYNKAKKAITAALKEGPATIPELASKTGMEQDKVTFYLMTMLKFGLVEVDSLDDMDEYYYYKLKNK